jgi:hypothetical protein
MFVFDGAGAAPLQASWFDMSAEVNALGYSNSIRNLKNLVHKTA